MENRVRNIATGIALILCMFNLHGQGAKNLNAKDLPQLVDPDTVVIRVEVWIQTPSSEIKQRHKIKVLERRQEQVKQLIHKKEGYEAVMDTLLTEMNELERENDSLQMMIVEQGKDLTTDMQQKLLVNNMRLKESRQQYFSLQKKFVRSRRAVRASMLVNIAAVLLLIVML